MGLHPTIRDIENPYSRWWWNGWLWGVVAGVVVSGLVVIVSAWAGGVL